MVVMSTPIISYKRTTPLKANQFLGGGFALLSSEMILLASMLPVLTVHNVSYRAKNSWQASSDLMPKEDQYLLSPAYLPG